MLANALVSTPKVTEPVCPSPPHVSESRLHSGPMTQSALFPPKMSVTALAVADRTQTLKEYTYELGALIVCSIDCGPAPLLLNVHAAEPPQTSGTPAVSARRGAVCHTAFCKSSLQAARLPQGSTNVKPLR